jgi:hypothetical protein
MHVALKISFSLDSRDIEIDDEFDLMHVKTAGEEIGRDNDFDIAISELLDVLISLVLMHSTEYDGCRITCSPKRIEDSFREVKGVHEDDGLSLINESIEYVFDKVDLSSLLALIIELLNFVKI